MQQTSVPAQTRPVPQKRLGCEGPVALVAAGASARRIATALRREELTITTLEDAEAPLARTTTDAPAVVVVYVEAAAESARDRIELLRQRFPTTPLIVVCASVERRAIRSMFAAGVTGIVLRAELESTIGPCLLAVKAGQMCLPYGAWRELDPPVLSRREKQVLGLVVMGYMNSQIASQLFLAESTIKSHLSSAFGKLGVRSRHEAVERILDPDGGFGVGILAVGAEPIQRVPVRR